MAKSTEFQRDVLKLARAMEQGCAKTHGARGVYLEKQGKSIAACALGAAFVNGFSLKGKLVRTTVEDHVDLFDLLIDRFPVLYSGPSNESLNSHIVELNDIKKWPRRRIIAWLRRVAERGEPPNSWDEVK